MSISYPLTVPTSPGFIRFRWRARTASAATRSPYSFAQRVQNNPGDMWACEATLPKMRRAQAEEWIALWLACRGRKGTFLIGPPEGAAPRGSFAGTPLVNGAVAARATALPIRGLTPSATGAIKKGDYMQIGSGATTRLYKSLEDADADGSGEATVEVFPKIRDGLSDGAAIVTASPKGTFAFATSDADWDLDRLVNFGISFVAEEALR